MQQWIDHKKTAAKSFYEKYQKYWPATFFLLGFVFDVAMLGRIDSLEVIGQQLFYIMIVALMLVQMLKEEKNPVVITESTGWFKRQWYKHRLELLHFLFGTLLNFYMIFYFKSSSIIGSFLFIMFMIAILVANELPRFRSQGLAIKFALFSLIVYSFSAYLLPILCGQLNAWVFYFSLLLGYLPFVIAGWRTQQKSPVYFELMKTNVLIPATLVLIFFVGGYALKIIPPVPLSLPFIGVYHSVDKTSDGYKLGHERPKWKIWETGDQTFVAQPGDKVFIFFRIYSPTAFADQIYLAWLHKDPRQGWKVHDRIPIKIVGGRESGFRGYAAKANYEPGDWRAQVETADGREIGRIYFDLELSPQQVRTFSYDTQ